MADGRQRAEWGRTSSILALIANVNRDPKKRRKPFGPGDFSPFTKRRARPVTDLGQLADEMTRFGAKAGRKRDRKQKRANTPESD